MLDWQHARTVQVCSVSVTSKWYVAVILDPLEFNFSHSNYFLDVLHVFVKRQVSSRAKTIHLYTHLLCFKFLESANVI